MGDGDVEKSWNRLLGRRSTRDWSSAAGGAAVGDAYVWLSLASSTCCGCDCDWARVVDMVRLVAPDWACAGVATAVVVVVPAVPAVPAVLALAPAFIPAPALVAAAAAATGCLFIDDVNRRCCCRPLLG